MNETLLNGMPVDQFFMYLGVALLGVLFYFASRVYIAINKDSQTPNKFQWRYFWRGVIKLVGSLIVLPILIIYFSDAVPFILKWLITIPEEMEIPIQINGWSAFLLGVVADFLVQKAFTILGNMRKK